MAQALTETRKDIRRERTLIETATFRLERYLALEDAILKESAK